MIKLISSRDFPLVSGMVKIENMSCKIIMVAKNKKIGQGLVLYIAITEGPTKVINAANIQ